MNGKIVCYYLGLIMLVEAVCMSIPMLICIFTKDSAWIWFLCCILFSAVLGFIFTRKYFKQGRFFVREGYLITALGWIVLSVIGAFPFFLSGRIPNYFDALFEIVSGFTTTGSSILAEVEPLGKGLLFWRSFSHWLGGMGVLVLVLAIMPMNGGYHMQIMKAESPGPSVSKMVPRTSDTAKILYGIYLALTVFMIICYLISGMNLFDAICIGFGTAGTGGFAVRNSGMADYSIVSQVLITIFMILFGVNFNVYYLIVRKKWKDALKSEEVRIYLIIFLVVAVTVSLLVFFNVEKEHSYLYSLHHSAFTAASLMTTTGFATLDFDTWPQLARLLLVLLMFIGACAGSTGGGIKVSRIIILFKEAKKELHMLIHPQSVRPIQMDKKTLEHDVIRSVNGYLVLYIFIFVAALILVSLDGFDLTTSFTAVAATINNIGPGLNAVGPTCNFSQFSIMSKVVLTICMLAGRLELLPMLMLFYRKTWTKHF